MLAEKEVERYVKATKELSDKLVELTGDKELNQGFENHKILHRYKADWWLGKNSIRG